MITARQVLLIKIDVLGTWQIADSGTRGTIYNLINYTEIYKNYLLLFYEK